MLPKFDSAEHKQLIKFDLHKKSQGYTVELDRLYI